MPKKILMIVQNNSFPFDKRVHKEALSLIKNSYKVFVISPISEYDHNKNADVNGIKVIRYKNFTSNGSFIGFVGEFLISFSKIYFLSFFLILKERIKIIHVANPPDFFWPLALICKLSGIKFIYDQHDLAPELFKTKFRNKFLYELLLISEKLSVLMSDGIIVVNNSFKRRLINQWNVKNKIIEVIYNGPEKDFRPIKNIKLTEKYESRKVILFIGLMNLNDNIEIIIESANKIINDLNKKDCFFILLGDGEVRKKMEDMVSKFHLEDYIEFTGIVSYEKVMEYLSVADVCIAPDQPNGLNEYLTLIKILEYMKAKKPFVAFNLKETRNLAGNSGLYANNLDDFVEKIIYILSNPKEANKMGEEGEAIIENEYLWEHSENKLLDLYQKLLN